MKHGKLTRLESTPENGTFGALTIDGVFCCLTLEPFELGNARSISCIPVGRYIVRRDSTGRHRYFRVQDVPGRTAIEFHLGNDINDTEGCVITGSCVVRDGETRKLLRSADAMEVLNSMIGDDDEWVLDVVRGY